MPLFVGVCEWCNKAVYSDENYHKAVEYAGIYEEAIEFELITCAACLNLIEKERQRLLDEFYPGRRLQAA